MAGQMLSAAALVTAGPSHSDPVKTQLKLDVELWNAVRGAYKWDKDKAVVAALVEAGADVNLKLFDGADVDFTDWYQMRVDLQVKGVDYTTIFPFPWDREDGGGRRRRSPVGWTPPHASRPEEPPTDGAVAARAWREPQSHGAARGVHHRDDVHANPSWVRSVRYSLFRHPASDPGDVRAPALPRTRAGAKMATCHLSSSSSVPVTQSTIGRSCGSVKRTIRPTASVVFTPSRVSSMRFRFPTANGGKAGSRAGFGGGRTVVAGAPSWWRSVRQGGRPWSNPKGWLAAESGCAVPAKQRGPDPVPARRPLHRGAGTLAGRAPGPDPAACWPAGSQGCHRHLVRARLLRRQNGRGARGQLAMHAAQSSHWLLISVGMFSLACFYALT